MPWEVHVTEEFERWWDALAEEHQDALTARIAMLRHHGPALGRPTVDTIAGSRLANLKELRATIGRAPTCAVRLRPARRAVLLVRGNKAGQWQSWYRRAIPQAEELHAKRIEMMRRNER